MNIQHFHQDTSNFLNHLTERGLLTFTNDWARSVGMTYNLKMHLVYRDLKEAGIIAQSPKDKNVWIINIYSLEYYFNDTRWN